MGVVPDLAATAQRWFRSGMLGLGIEFGAVLVMVVVSPFPLLPVFEELLSVPQPAVQLAPLLVKAQWRPRSCHYCGL